MTSPSNFHEKFDWLKKNGDRPHLVFKILISLICTLRKLLMHADTLLISYSKVEHFSAYNVHIITCVMEEYSCFFPAKTQRRFTK